jgi:hypothetical protein
MFTKQELKVFRQLNTPQRVQLYMQRNFKYNKELRGETCRSPRVVLRTKTAHCIEGALFAAACFRMNSRKPLILDLAAGRDHDHVIAVFKQDGLWGAVSFSQFNSLQWRDPIYRNLRELALSYFPFYYNFNASKTLKTYSLPVNLERFDSIEWMTSEENLWDIGNYLFTVKHHPLYPKKARKNILPMDKNIMAFDRRRWR